MHSEPTTPGEDMVLMHVATAAIPVLLATIGAAYVAGAEWLVQRRILVPASADPLLSVPYAAGAGLDAARLAIAMAATVAVLVVAVSAVRARRLKGVM